MPLEAGSEVSSGIPQSHPLASDGLRTTVDVARDEQGHRKVTMADTKVRKGSLEPYMEMQVS